MSTSRELFQLAIRSHESGDLANAEALYHQVLQADLAHADAHHMLGILTHQSGHPEAAVAQIRQAISLMPIMGAYHFSLGSILMELGHSAEAANCFQQTLVLVPEHPQAHISLGNSLQRLGKMAEAIACYRQALHMNPKNVSALNNLATALMFQDQRAKAVECLRHALRIQPDYVMAHFNLGNVFKDLGQLAEAIRCFQDVLRLSPNLAGAHNNLGNLLKEEGRFDEALVCYRRACQLEPDNAVWHSNLLYCLNFDPLFNHATLLDEHRNWNRRHGEPLAKLIQPHANDSSHERRLRIGYISPDFREHCQSFFMMPLLSAHDHENFEIFCYADVSLPDKMTSRLQARADVWRDIAGQTDEQVAHLVRQDRIDILVDLTMHMANNRLLVLARKPAPVQVSWLAYPGTTGVAAIDYRLTDPYLDPANLDGSYYSEKSVWLPDSFWCYDPLTSEPALNPLPALKNGYLTFGCLNNFCKLNSQTLKLWAKALQATGSSRLVLLAPDGEYRGNILGMLAQEGIAADRITFVAKQSRPRYLELYHEIDLGLDTLPYNGHTTSLDAAWMGVPVLTLVGQTVVGRAGVSLLSNLGMPEFIAQTPEQFVRCADQWSGDLQRLSQVRSSLRRRLEESPLMDGPRFARNVEAAYQAIWRKWCDRD